MMGCVEKSFYRVKNAMLLKLFGFAIAQMDYDLISLRNEKFELIFATFFQMKK